jgi:hypothetical protein
MNVHFASAFLRLRPSRFFCVSENNLSIFLSSFPALRSTVDDSNGEEASGFDEASARFSRKDDKLSAALKEGGRRRHKWK